jgi:predicted AAA+ superfamily ATPase
MKRLIDHYLQQWKNSSRRKALLIRGARQVGKTYSVRRLGESFEELVEINLEMNPEYAEVFRLNLDPQRILRELRLMTGKRLVPGSSLLFIDEIQQHPAAVTALRYFYEEIPELHVAAAGSLLEFALEQVGIPVGRVASLHMYPVSFLEFLVARGKSSMVELMLEEKYMLSIGDPIHDLLLRLVGEYLVLGGFPEVVQTWIDHEELDRCGEILDVITAACRQDFTKYSKRHQIKYVDLVFSEIPALAGKKFKYTALPGVWKAREISPALDLLCKASVLHKVTHSSGNGMPLKAESDPSRFKTLMMDVGLSQRTMGANIKPWLLNPSEAINNSGPVIESFVGQELLAYSNPWVREELFYWHREARASNAEVDYIIAIGNAIIPIEVKAGATGRLRSLRMFLDAKRSTTPYGIRFSGQRSSMHGDLHSYSLYAIPHVLRDNIPLDWF